MQTRAFTLIELSIVLIIIGLLVGGVLAGRDLIRQAAVSRTTSDWQTYQAALNTYVLKYDAIPGDHDEAYSYFGSICGGSSGNCNGTGDGRISNSCTGSDAYIESLRFWMHLGLAEIIPGTFSGQTNGSCANYPDNTDNAPVGPLTGSTYSIWNMSYPGAYGVSQGDMGVAPYPRFWLRFGGDSNSNGYQLGDGEMLTVGESYALDAKSDDGVANSGKIRMQSGARYWDGSSNTYVTDNVATNFDYILSAGSDLKYTDSGVNFWLDPGGQ